MRTDQVHVHRANSQANKFKLYLLENESLNGKILFYILHLFSRVRTRTITSYRLFAAVQLKLSQPQVYRISKVDFHENETPYYTIWLQIFHLSFLSRRIALLLLGCTIDIETPCIPTRCCTYIQITRYCIYCTSNLWKEHASTGYLSRVFVVISTGIITRWPIVVLNLLLSGRSISAPIVSGRHVTEVEAGASSEAKEERRGTLIRRTFPLIWASVLEPKPGGRPATWEGPRGSGLRLIPRDACWVTNVYTRLIHLLPYSATGLQIAQD